MPISIIEKVILIPLLHMAKKTRKNPIISLFFLCVITNWAANLSLAETNLWTITAVNTSIDHVNNHKFQYIG